MDRIYKESSTSLEPYINTMAERGWTVESVGAFSYDAKYQHNLTGNNQFVEKVTTFWVVMSKESDGFRLLGRQ